MSGRRYAAQAASISPQLLFKPKQSNSAQERTVRVASERVELEIASEDACAPVAWYHPGVGNQIMLYLSQVLGRPILDLDGERVATLKDVIVRLAEEDHPPVAGFVARYRRRNFFLPRWRISNFGENGVRLNSDILDLRPFMRRDGE